MIVSDTSPLCYLVLIGEVALLPQLFDHVVLPREVQDELLPVDAPPPVRQWAAVVPEWVSVVASPTIHLPPMGRLHTGERSAILVAEALQSEIILMDEKAARRIAQLRGLRVTGTLGVLADAAKRGFVDLPGAIHRLQGTTFRVSPALLKATLDRFKRE